MQKAIFGKDLPSSELNLLRKQSLNKPQLVSSLRYKIPLQLTQDKKIQDSLPEQVVGFEEKDLRLTDM